MSLPMGELEVAVESELMSDGSEQGPRSIAGRSLWAIAWRRLRRNKAALVSGVIIIILVNRVLISSVNDFP